MKYLNFGSLLLLLCIAVANASPRKVVNFDSNWKFIQKDGQGFESPVFNDQTWTTLDVPHDWSIEGEYSKDHPMGDRCGYLPSGIGWYRKTITVPESWKNKHVRIVFDGVFHNSTVWANGQKLGFRPYGWISFDYDLSEFVYKENVLNIAVRVDNSKQPSARWYTGSGIYAPVNIIVTDKVHIPQSGVFVRTKGISETSEISIETEVRNTLPTDAEVKLVTRLLSPNRTEVAKIEQIKTLSAGKTEKFSQNTLIKNPQIWSCETPNLYTAVSEVTINGSVVDSNRTRFGIRDIEWKAKTGFWLNGKNVKLQGVCNHQDAGPLGAAVPDKILRYRIQQLKDMGCNAIRTAHNPQTPIFYDICDELGMLVMDEIYDGWKRKAANDYGAHYFNEWWKKDVTDWIRRDRNHPSVVIYSVGNETRGPVAKDLVAHCHALDTTRPVTSGHSGTPEMDVAGYNGHSEFKGFFEEKHPNGFDKPFVGTENPHTWQVRGFYRSKTWYRDGLKKFVYPIADLTEEEIFSNYALDSENKRNRKQIFNSSYDNGTVRLSARKSIEQLRDIPHYAGQFRWTGFDYIGEAGYVHGGWPFKAFMGGAIDLANFEKDLYYLYQSQWTTTPMVHILPHWTHPKMKPGTKIPIWVYSNCEEVELFHNGKSFGKQKPGTKWQEMQCQWLVPWQPGEIKAIAYNSEQAVSQQIIKSAGVPAQIALSVDGKPLKPQGTDIVQLRVESQDKDGNFYPYGENRTYFHINGPAKIKCLGNGNPIDVEQHYRVNNRNGFMGLTRAFIESTGEAGDISVVAASILGEKRQITSKKVSIDVKQFSLRGTLKEQDIKVFYTTDGSTPTENSKSYAGSFEVELGTTVKALVIANGQPILSLSEKFDKNLGLSWTKQKTVTKQSIRAEQAENAKFSNAKVDKTKKRHRGKGYLLLKDGGQVEWYLENDGGPETKTFTIRYSTKEPTGEGIPVTLIINKKSFNHIIKPGRWWNDISSKAKLNSGANTVILKTEKGGILIDELNLR